MPSGLRQTKTKQKQCTSAKEEVKLFRFSLPMMLDTVMSIHPAAAAEELFPSENSLPSVTLDSLTAGTKSLVAAS